MQGDNAEAKALRAELDALRRKSKALQHDINKIESRLMAIKWASNPIGSICEDDRGVKFRVGGYRNNWILGYKIRKDGTPGTKLVNVYNVKE
jgi:hypothetical protein